MRHAELVLRVVRALVRRVEREELAELVHREHEVVRAAFFEIRVADGELRVGTQRRLRVRLNHLFEVLAGGDPFLRLERRIAFVVEKLVGLLRPGGNGLLEHHDAAAGLAAPQLERE